MRPNGPSQTAQRLGVQWSAFRVKFGISVSSHLRASPDQSFAVFPSREAGSGSLHEIARSGHPIDRSATLHQIKMRQMRGSIVRGCVRDERVSYES